MEVPKTDRGQGIANRLLTEAVRKIEKDHPGKDIRLSADPLDEETDLDRLVEFYERYGFESDEVQGGDGVFMTRKPGSYMPDRSDGPETDGAAAGEGDAGSKDTGNTRNTGEDAGIEGVSGDTEGSEDGIRYMLAEYSEGEIRDIVKILKPYVGVFADRAKSEYQKYLAGQGVEISEKDAWNFALEAARQNNAEARQRARKRRDDWIYENNPLWRECVDFCGGAVENGGGNAIVSVKQ